MNCFAKARRIKSLNRGLIGSILIILMATPCFCQVEIDYRPNEDQSIALGDGRMLGFAEYGDPEGYPVVYHYGGGGSRLLGRRVDSLAAFSGVRLIVPDRPGMGKSDYMAGRQITDWPIDLVELMDSMGIDTFAVVSESAGTPYALVVAHALPERVSAAAIVAGLCPMDGDFDMKVLPRTVRMSMKISRKAPLWFLRWNIKTTQKMVTNKPDRFLKAVSKQFSEPDRKLMADPAEQETMLIGFTEAGRKGPEGAALEMRLYSRPWGFDPGEIKVPVNLHHGLQDSNAPALMAEHLASLIPGSTLKLYPGEGHATVMSYHGAEILHKLIAK